MSSFDNILDVGYIDYTAEAEKQDLKLRKKKNIEQWMEKYTSIYGTYSFPVVYEINSNCTINTFTSCYIKPIFYEDELPEYIQFNEIEGSFGISNLKIKSLRGCPKKVKGDFYCNNNENLRTLEFGPDEVLGTYFCGNKRLKSFFGSPIKGCFAFNCSGCANLETIDNIPHALKYYYNSEVFEDRDLFRTYMKIWMKKLKF